MNPWSMDHPYAPGPWTTPVAKPEKTDKILRRHQRFSLRNDAWKTSTEIPYW